MTGTVRALRPRRYVSPVLLWSLRWALRYSASRDAYVLRLVGNQHGPVLRPDRRRRSVPFDGHDRRHGAPAV